MTPALRRAGLVAHVFVEADGGRPCLLQLWDGVVTTFELDVVRDPGAADPARIGQIGFAEATPDGALRQAVLRSTDSALVLSVLLEPADDDEGTWVGLDREWQEVVARTWPSDAPTFGTVRIYEGLTPDNQAVPAAARAVQPAIPGTADATAWPDRPHADPGGVTVWEIDPVDRLRTDRRFLAVAGRDREATLGAWLWTGPGLTPFVRTLLHAAVLRLEMRAHAEAAAPIEQVQDEADALTGEVLAKLAAADDLDRAAADDLLARCVRLEIRATSLARAGATLRRVKRSVDVARANRAAALPPAAPAQGDLFDDDERTGTDFAVLLDDEIHHVDAVRQGARDVVRAVRAAAERRSAALDAERDARRESFALLQTVPIGALVVLLTTVQALDYKVPLDSLIQPALITFLGAAPLALGLWLVRRHQLDTAPRSVRLWASVPVVAASIGLTAATAGWLLETTVRVLAGQAVDPAVSWAVAVSAGLLGTVIAGAVVRTQSH